MNKTEKKETFIIAYTRKYLFQFHEETEVKQQEIEAINVNEAIKGFYDFVNTFYKCDKIEIRDIHSFYPNSRHIYKKYDKRGNVIQTYSF